MLVKLSSLIVAVDGGVLVGTFDDVAKEFRSPSLCGQRAMQRAENSS